MIGQSYITRHTRVRQETKNLQGQYPRPTTAFPSIAGYAIVETVNPATGSVRSADIGQHENGIGCRTARIPASGLFRQNCS